jgi:selenocysteine-specific elongation factor
VSPAARAEARARVEAAVDGAGPEGADVASMDERLRALLPRVDGLVIDRGRVRRAGIDAPPVESHPWLLALEASPFAPPAPDDVPRAEVRDLVRRGLVVEEDGFFFAVAALETARQQVAGTMTPEGLTMSALREVLETSRKYAVPLATMLDRRGVTARRGDVRVAGKRIDQPIEAQPL